MSPATDPTDLARMSDGDDPVNQPDEDGWCPLHEAAFRSDIAMAEVLLAQGADVNVKGPSSATPLHCSCQGLSGRKTRADLVRFLLSRGANVNVADERGIRPLHEAAGSGDIAAVHLLLQAGADIDARDQWGNTPLHVAASAGEVVITCLPNRRPREAILAAYIAILESQAAGEYELHPMRQRPGSRTNVGVVQLLLDLGADPNARNHSGRTPLDEAVRWRRTWVAALWRNHAPAEIAATKTRLVRQGGARAEERTIP